MVEPDWYKVMERVLGELTKVAEFYSAPILCAGDIFDRWNSIPELTNWAIDNLPVMYAIPGQHDLPQHNYEERHRSAYMTLVKADRLLELPPGQPTYIPTPKGTIIVVGFPWGHEIRKPPTTESSSGHLVIAVAHQFVWRGRSTAYPGATRETAITRERKELLDYDTVIFGDNHKGFSTHLEKTHIFNCGTMMRRHIDDLKTNPQIGLLYEDGSVSPYYLNTENDLIDKTMKEMTDPEIALDIQDFLTELSGLTQKTLDFRKLIMRFIRDNHIGIRVKEFLLKAMEE